MRTKLALCLICVFTTVQAEHTHAGIEFSIGARMKLDAIYSDNSRDAGFTNKADLAFSPASISIPESNHSSFEISPRETRFWGILDLPLLGDRLSTYVEFDFLEVKKDALGRTRLVNTPRLRHVYGTFKNLTVGRTYTTFVNLSSYPEINDGTGPPGAHNIRQDLIRTGGKFNGGEWMFALENPVTTLRLSTGQAFASDKNCSPDIVGKLKFSGNWGNWSVSVMLRQLRIDNPLFSADGDSRWGGALSTAGRIYTKGENNLRFALTLGNAAGRYFSFGAFSDAVLDDRGELHPTDILGGYLAYQHWWTPQLRSSLVLGATTADQHRSIQATTTTKLFASSSLNLLWSPTAKSTIGVEWLYGYHRLENLQSGDADRVQLTFDYKF